MVKYEFDNLEEYEDAIRHLDRYHDCDKCHGRIVGISIDKLGNTFCGYCGQIVKYPKLSEIGKEKLLEEISH